MADLIDNANNDIISNIEYALANRSRYKGESLTHCCECGEEISEGRRKVLKGVRLCVDCASELEIGDRLYGR